MNQRYWFRCCAGSFSQIDFQNESMFGMIDSSVNDVEPSAAHCCACVCTSDILCTWWSVAVNSDTRSDTCNRPETGSAA